MTTPGQLSAAEVSGEMAPLPFGLVWDDVAAALPGFAGGGTARVSHRTRGRHRGGHPHAIMTLAYRTSGGERGERTLFFKRNPDGARESSRYAFLGPAGTP